MQLPLRTLLALALSMTASVMSSIVAIGTCKLLCVSHFDKFGVPLPPRPGKTECAWDHDHALIASPFNVEEVNAGSSHKQKIWKFKVDDKKSKGKTFEISGSVGDVGSITITVDNGKFGGQNLYAIGFEVGTERRWYQIGDNQSCHSGRRSFASTTKTNPSVKAYLNLRTVRAVTFEKSSPVV